MKLNRILVVYKKSSFSIYAKERKDPRITQLLHQKHPTVKFMLQGHRVHQKTLEGVQRILKRRKIAHKLMYRANQFKEAGWDMVLSVGGDGTFLEAAHRLQNVPILGLNSNPRGSVGFFCGARLETLDDILTRIEDGKLRPLKLHRLELVGGEGRRGRVILNDCLIANSNPAATSRMKLSIEGQSLSVKCSGVWVSTAAGSTGAIRSAGGKILPLQSARYHMLVREPYRMAPDPMYKAYRQFSPETALHVTSQMRDGMIYIDGAHHPVAFPLGETIVVKHYPYPLGVLGYNIERRRQLEV